MLEEPGDEREGVVDTPQAIEPHRFDGFTHGEITPCRMLVGGLIEDVAHAECVTHARDKPQMISDRRAIRLRL